MQNHFNVQVMIVILAVRASLNPHILLVVIEHLIEFEAGLKLVWLRRH